MAEIRDRPSDIADSSREVHRSRQQADDQVRELVKAAQRDRARAVDLARVDIRQVETSTRDSIAKLLADMMRGQIPGEMTKALVSGGASANLLEQLLKRLGDTSTNRMGKVANADTARDMATDKSTPQQALRWTQFVQKVLHVPGAEVRGRAGSAAPKGEGTTLLEMLAGRAGVQGPGLRNPQLVERQLTDLSPRQRALLMRATFGEKLATALEELGIHDPLAFVRSGALPADREGLANALGMARGKLLVLLMRAELLKIGPGQNGELGIRPDMLGPLGQAGIAMLGTLASLRGLSQEELAYVYWLMRKATAGFERALKGGRPVVKRDLLHWSRTAGRRPSDILLADFDTLSAGGGMSQADAQELIQAWYLENLLWQELAHGRRRREESASEQRREEQRRRERDEEAEERRDEDDERDAYDDLPDMQYDSSRSDRLMCFWVTDYNPPGLLAGAVRRMYVCVDPDSGAIIPQMVEAEAPIL